MSAHTDFRAYIATLLRDPLAAVRDVKDRRIIGYVGDVPVELIHAADAIPVRLRGILGSTPNADRYLERSFAPDARSIAEQWLTGRLDFVSTVIFPRSDDSAQRLYYYLCELQRVGRAKGPKPLLFDSSTLTRKTSLEHTLDSVRRLAQALGTDRARLHAALARTAKRNDLVAQITARRLDGKSPRGSEAFEVRCVAESDWSESYDAAILNWLSNATTNVHMRRLLFVGSAPPDARFHLAAERAGAVIVHEAIGTEYARVAPDSDAFQFIATRHHGAETLAHRMLRSRSHSVELARRMRADGVILWAIEEDEALPWEISRQAAALREAKIPTFLLTREQWNASDSVLEQVAEFAKTLRSPT